MPRIRITLDAGESEVFARAALALKYDEDKPAPITESQILMPRRHDDSRRDLWSVFNRTQENLIKGGLSAAPRMVAARPRARCKASTTASASIAPCGCWPMACAS